MSPAKMLRALLIRCFRVPPLPSTIVVVRTTYEADRAGDLWRITIIKDKATGAVLRKREFV